MSTCETLREGSFEDVPKVSVDSAQSCVCRRAEMGPWAEKQGKAAWRVSIWGVENKACCVNRKLNSQIIMLLKFLLCLRKDK